MNAVREVLVDRVLQPAFRPVVRVSRPRLRGSHIPAPSLCFRTRPGAVTPVVFGARFPGPELGPEKGTKTKYTHSGCTFCLSRFPARFLGRNPGP